jgi:hypothetical protein
LDADQALELVAFAGAKYFMTDNVALFSQFEVDWASEDLYLDNNDADGSDWLITLGLRFLFDL